MVQAPFCFNSLARSVVKDGVIVGVSVITEGEAKGHDTYIDGETLKTVKECAETYTDGVRVKIDHGTGFDSIVGVLRNFRIEGPKLLADLHLLKSHSDFSRIVEIAETMPGSVGLSISFSGTSEEKDGKFYARCTELYSVDFVDRPAANPSGLFSVVDSSAKGMAEKFDSFVAGLKGLVGMTENADLAAAQKNVTELSAKIETLNADLKAANEKATKAETELKASGETINKLQTELAAVPAKIEAEGSKKAQQIMAGLGQPPIASAPAANPAEGQPKISELKGLAKVEAAFKAQSAAKANLNAK